MNRIEQENAIIEGRVDSSHWGAPHCTEIEGFFIDMATGGKPPRRTQGDSEGRAISPFPERY